MTQHLNPIVIDLNEEGENIERNGITGPITNLTVYPENWPKNKPVPDEVKKWFLNGVANGSILVGHNS
ncbi:hypothetical protein [Bifidobacterium oedipodis]|uniref:Uncharacterized protein n=1 Tax=Bifidobacterium oedipodis TaxID=2675322 RepID=A0A7Y0ERF6_9BIFI|nr:hypothetical protein [Bifidobacterium sp. DSM 109957]NMM94603.1 hypothetical protein [Bifidobacterium sp. DSM 109957]